VVWQSATQQIVYHQLLLILILKLVGLLAIRQLKLFSFLGGFSVPIVFALSIFDRWVHKVGLRRSRSGSVSVARQLEVAICAGAFSDVSH
jgi:hypothetical protein